MSTPALSVSRRRLLVAAGGLLFAAGCKRASASPASCTDVSSLAEEERNARAMLGYADRATDPARACSACQQWLTATREGACGGCKLLKGPIHPDGTCKAFAPRG